MTPEQQAQLREEFPASQVGKLPKAGMHLDYVGHGAVTDRLLNVDPEWTWEPVAFDERGLPALDDFGNLWIKLTVGGVTRYGVGDGPDMKQRIGDALRNAAMRFGVALDLWIRGHAEDDEKVGASSPPREVDLSNVEGMSARQVNDALRALRLPLGGTPAEMKQRLADAAKVRQANNHTSEPQGAGV